ncbi:MAG: metallophosphoesterase [Eubacteriales bacterium]|nr:metallophosphoesterase [Eubacteriales bacterium]
MALFAIADLHLSFSTDKPMNIFGNKWENYEERLKENWNNYISVDDTVVICGDISWATYIEDAVCDFEFIHKLNGHKIILKGNHDYWWTTMSKMNAFLSQNNFSTISVLHNNSFEVDGISLCGTRGWMPYELCKKADDKKVYERELQRLELSLKEAKCENIVACLHYPPDDRFLDLMKKYSVGRCLFGHLHAKSQENAPQGVFDGIECRLVSGDYLDFLPIKID